MCHGTIIESISTHSHDWQKFISFISGLNFTAHTFWVLGESDDNNLCFKFGIQL